jgi:hypothetical protein
MGRIFADLIGFDVSLDGGGTAGQRARHGPLV